jgi:chorismate lyase/3-hydroxybenzoate synthase
MERQSMSSSTLRSDSSIELVPRYAAGPDPAALALIAFEQRVDGAVFVPARRLGPAPLIEIWPSVDHGEVMFGSAAADGEEPIETATRRIYGAIIDRTRQADHPHFLRIWNHVGGINDADEGRERYQLFCAGRHDAFVDAGYHHGADLPAASAVGMPGRGLVTWFLAARTPGLQIENPRQVSAYRYPPQYGSKSPSFSRATVWRDTVFVSGTSSVVGHQTMHAEDVEAQLEETLQNIEAVLGRAGCGMENVVTAKTYIRRAADYEVVSRRLQNVFAQNLFLEADICRPNLLLEIEVVARAR